MLDAKSYYIAAKSYKPYYIVTKFYKPYYIAAESYHIAAKLFS